MKRFRNHWWIALPFLFAAFSGSWPDSLSTAKTLLQKELRSPATFRTRSLYLSVEEQKQLQRLDPNDDISRIYTVYMAYEKGDLAAIGMFDNHMVRTKKETLFVIISPSGQLLSIEVIDFQEPGDYFPPARWLRLFRGMNPESSSDSVSAITGATFTTRAVRGSVRRFFQIYEWKLKQPTEIHR